MNNILTDIVAASQGAKNGLSHAYKFKHRLSGKWMARTWNQFAREIDNAANAFCALNIQPQEMVAVFAANCPEILATDFGCFRNRAIPVSIYATSSPEQVKYIVNDSGAKLIMVGDQRQYRIARNIFHECPTLERIVRYDSEIVPDLNDRDSISFVDLLANGAEASQEIRDEVARRAAAATPDDTATLLYTSGTTGEPKGAILTHSNFTAALEIHKERLTMLGENELSLSFLPMSHIFEKAWTCFCLYRGIVVAINSNPKEIQLSLREVRPSCMCSVPRFWEKAYTAVQDKFAAATGIRKFFIQQALRVGRKRNIEYKRVGKKVPFFIEKQYQLYHTLVYHTIQRAIGVENGTIFPTAGAPLSPNIVEFFHSVGINIVIGYGLSETTATVSCFPEVGFQIGSCGTTIPRVQVKIGENNEVLVKAPTVLKGYYNRPDATAAAFTEDGWFRTGDAGYLNPDGSIVLTERIKDLFKTSNGKYIAPQAIESRLGEDRFIEQVAVIGDCRKYVTALIIPAFEALKEFAISHNISFKTLEDLVNNDEIKEFFAERIESLQQGLASHEKIKRFTLLAKEFSMETGELTNTLKIRRPVINERYAAQIEAMYY